MVQDDLVFYCSRAINAGASHAKVIHPSSVVTAPWVRIKCQFGCPGYGMRYSCPPDSPTHDQMREVLDQYTRVILFHRVSAHEAGQSRIKATRRFLDELVTLEGEMFKDGYYKALVLLEGPCHLCETCEKLKGAPCRFRDRARPAMEACGIDVYQTARNNGFPIQPLRDKTETQNLYCLMLVD